MSESNQERGVESWSIRQWYTSTRKWNAAFKILASQAAYVVPREKRQELVSGLEAVRAQSTHPMDNDTLFGFAKLLADISDEALGKMVVSFNMPYCSVDRGYLRNPQHERPQRKRFRR